MHWGSVIELIHITASLGHGFPLQWSICISQRSPSKPATQSHQNFEFSEVEVRWFVGWRCRQIPLTHGEERQGSETALISQRSPLNPFGQRHLKLFTVQIYVPTILTFVLLDGEIWCNTRPIFIRTRPEIVSILAMAAILARITFTCITIIPNLGFLRTILVYFRFTFNKMILYIVVQSQGPQQFTGLSVSGNLIV